MPDDTTAPQAFPRLSYAAPRSSRPGTHVDEINLAPADTPLAPFKASRFTVEPGASSRVDSHAVHELWMIAAGEGELIYDAQALRVRAGDVVYFEPPKTHQLHNDGTERVIIFSVWWGP